MTDAGNVEGRISSWLEAEEAGTHYPDQLLSATFDRTRELRQARSLRWGTFRVFRSPRSLPAAGAAAIAVLTIGVLGFNLATNQPGPASSPSPSPTVAPPSSLRTSSPPDYMWPQSTLDEVRAAQELADAGDVRYTWQIDRDLGSPGNLGQHHPGENGDHAKIFARFLEEELGWKEFLWTEAFAHPDPDRLEDGEVVYIRCAAGQTNPLYPVDPNGAGCAPTIDELTYETARIQVAQLDRQGGSGIWVVTRWAIEPATQADPRVEEAQATALLEDFLQARIGGDGAEELTGLPGGLSDEEIAGEIPLLYATSTGAPYERSEFQLVDGPTWPLGRMQFEVRLFADNDETVVEQRFSPVRDETGRMRVDYDRERATIENGKAVPVEYSLFDGEVTYRVAAPFTAGTDEFRDVVIEGPLSDDGALRFLMLADPTPFAPGCLEANAPDAKGVAEIIGSNPRFEATAPVGVAIGGLPALRMDVVRAQGAGICEWSEADITESGPLMKYARWELGEDRARLYLIDLPEGSQARVLALVTITDEDSFETVLEAAAPVIDSIEFHTP